MGGVSLRTVQKHVFCKLAGVAGIAETAGAGGVGGLQNASSALRR